MKEKHTQEQAPETSAQERDAKTKVWDIFALVAEQLAKGTESTKRSARAAALAFVAAGATGCSSIPEISSDMPLPTGVEINTRSIALQIAQEALLRTGVIPAIGPTAPIAIALNGVDAMIALKNMEELRWREEFDAARSNPNGGTFLFFHENDTSMQDVWKYELVPTKEVGFQDVPFFSTVTNDGVAEAIAFGYTKGYTKEGVETCYKIKPLHRSDVRDSAFLENK